METMLTKGFIRSVMQGPVHLESIGVLQHSIP